MGKVKARPISILANGLTISERRDGECTHVDKRYFASLPCHHYATRLWGQPELSKEKMIMMAAPRGSAFQVRILRKARIFKG